MRLVTVSGHNRSMFCLSVISSICLRYFPLFFFEELDTPPRNAVWFMAHHSKVYMSGPQHAD